MGIAQRIKSSTNAALAITVSPFSKALSKRYLMNYLTSTTGVSVKIAQMLANTIGEVSAEENPNLQENKLETSQLRSIYKSQSPALYEKIDVISEQGKLASIGQVNKVILKNGVNLAVKTQYPGVKDNIDGQLRLLVKAASIGPAAKYGFDSEEYFSYLKKCLLAELDYTYEAKNQKKHYELFQDQRWIEVPEVLDFYSTDTLLVQKWVDSTKPSDVLKWPVEYREMAASILVKYFFEALFLKKTVHCDLHKNNFGFQKRTTSSPRDEEIALVLYDFGATLSISDDKVQALYEIICHLSGSKKISIINHLIFLGFDAEKLSIISKEIEAVMGAIFAPITQSKAFNTKDWMLGRKIDELLSENKWWFRTAGPTWFFMLLRAVKGVVSFVEGLEVEINAKNIFSKIVPQYKPIEIYVPQVVTCSGDTERTVPAKYLKVAVRENGKDIVNSSLPSKAIDNLRDLIPDKSLSEIENEMCLEDVITKIQRSGYRPQLVFEKFLKNGKSYKVWLA